MITVIYTKRGITYDHLRFRSARMCKRWLQVLRADGATGITIQSA